jgi:hypothetical protein
MNPLLVAALMVNKLLVVQISVLECFVVGPRIGNEIERNHNYTEIQDIYQFVHIKYFPIQASSWTGPKTSKTRDILESQTRIYMAIPLHLSRRMFIGVGWTKQWIL